MTSRREKPGEKSKAMLGIPKTDSFEIRKIRQVGKKKYEKPPERKRKKRGGESCREP